MNSIPSPSDSHREANTQPPLSDGSAAASMTHEQLTQGELMRIDLYEEIPTLDREITVREKVQIQKILIQESADSQP